MSAQPNQAVLDTEHLRLLRIGYFISAGTHLFGALFGLLYAGIGIFMVATLSRMPARQNAAPWIFAGIGGLLVLFVGGIGVLQLLAARALRERRSRTMCLVAAGATVISIPWGTALGIFTFNVLGRPSVIALFDGRFPTYTAAPPPPPPVPAAA